MVLLLMFHFFNYMYVVWLYSISLVLSYYRLSPLCIYLCDRLTCQGLLRQVLYSPQFLGHDNRNNDKRIYHQYNDIGILFGVRILSVGINFIYSLLVQHWQHLKLQVPLNLVIVVTVGKVLIRPFIVFEIDIQAVATILDQQCSAIEYSRSLLWLW